jgi:hypothetical protein
VYVTDGQRMERFKVTRVDHLLVEGEKVFGEGYIRHPDGWIQAPTSEPPSFSSETRPYKWERASGEWTGYLLLGCSFACEP